MVTLDLMMTAPATRKEALLALEAFVPTADRYATIRNFATARATTSRLSAPLRRRIILEEEAIHTVRSHHSFETAEKFLQEILWRTYWKGWLQVRPWVWEEYLGYLHRFDSEAPPEIKQRVARTISGETSLPYFNAWVRSLIETGYLHNHERMWFASIWIFTLQLPWQIGARFFLEHLLDGDPASNTLSWRWVAGLQTTGKHYLARADNISRFTEGQWSPRAGELNELAPAIADDGLAKSPPLAMTEPCVNIPVPRPPNGAPGSALLLHGEDLSVEVGALHNSPIQHLGILNPHPRAYHCVSNRVLAYESHALTDAVIRAREAWHVSSTAELTDIATSVVWSKCNGIRHIVCYRPFVGFLAPILLQLQGELAKEGVELLFIDRAHDALFLRFATKGFFPFWEKASRMLRNT
jgi:deoxyribodipyrimidine photo-lyase